MKLFLFIFYLLTFAACRDHADLAGQLKRINDAYRARNVGQVLTEFDPNVQFHTNIGRMRTQAGFNEMRTWASWLGQNNRVEFTLVRKTIGATVTQGDYRMTYFDGRRQSVEHGTIFVPKTTGKINKIIRTP